MKYKVGDKVRINSLDWYNENKNEYGYINCGSRAFFSKMSDLCSKIATVKDVCEGNYYRLEEYDFDWTDEMIEGLVEDGTIVDYVKESDDRYRIVIDPRFNIEVDEGEYYAVRRKKEYPKTYEECLSVLGIYNRFPDVEVYNAKPSECKLFESLIRLKRCRDAYWKIAGEEMGLGKPWEPDLEDDTTKYTIVYTNNGIERDWELHVNHILSFPTKEMRDAFYENFKELIETCKELL